MCRVAVVLIAFFPFSVSGQNEPLAGQPPSFMVRIQRTPERDIEQALRHASASQPWRSATYFGFEGADAERFREIGMRAREASEQNVVMAIQAIQRLCDEEETSREVISEQLLAAAESEQIPWDEAVTEVFESFSTEHIDVLIRRAATLSYSGYDTDWEEFFKVQDPKLFLDQACSAVANNIAVGPF